MSESWFYRWRDKPTTAREIRRGQLADVIRQIFEGSGGTYGSPMVWFLLVRAGWRVSVNSVARLMAELGLAGRKVRRRRGLTRPGKRSAAPDFVRRDFTADAPDQVWCGDLTEITNGLLRQCFPKGTDLSRWSAEDLEAVALAINIRPRKILGWKTPAEVFEEQLRSLLQLGVATTG